jgi:hypothetical protein
MGGALEQILKSASLYTDEQTYVIAHLPPGAITAAAGVLAEVGEPFGAVVVDKDEVTLILPSVWWDDFKHRLPEHEVAGPYRLITFDLPLELDLVGFMAAVSGALAAASVPIMPVAAYQRDHLLVPAGQFDAAWAALEALRE